MKLLISLLLVSVSYAGFSNTDQAVAYNDRIVNEQTKIGKAILEYSSNPNDQTLQGIKDQVKGGLAVLKSMKPYEGNSSLRDAAKDLFKFYQEVAEDEYKKIADLMKDSGKYTKDELVDKINKYADDIGKKEKPLDAKFQSLQEAFAKKYGFRITKNELQEQIDEQKGE